MSCHSSTFSRCLRMRSHTEKCRLRSSNYDHRPTTMALATVNVVPSNRLLLFNQPTGSSERYSSSGSDRQVGGYNDPRTKQKDVFPGIQRIILIRHGESLGNIDERAYVNTADWRIPLTKRGRDQARQAGRKVASQLCYGSLRHRAAGQDKYENDVDSLSGRVDADDAGRGGERSDADGKAGAEGKVFFYVSPYLRTRQTLREILREVDPKCIAGIREDPRIAEQQFGNFQSHHSIQDNKATRSDFGRFFYRFPDGGESGFDVYNRVSGFIGTLQRDSSQLLDNGVDLSSTAPSSSGNDDAGMTICIITHGLALRLFLMRWFQYTVHEFERSYNPKNGRVVVLKPSPVGGFELSERDRIAMGFPLYREQERFRLMDDYDLLEKSGW